jgi:hypothetical protein
MRPGAEALALEGPQTTDEILCSAAQQALPLGHLEPLNSAEEKAKVGADPRYNPVFRYAPQPIEQLKRTLEQLESLQIDPKGVGQFFLEARDYLCGRLRLRIHIGVDHEWQKPLYPMATPQVVLLARSLLSGRQNTDRQNKPFGAEHAVRMISARLLQYRITNWQVILKPNISATNTDSANRVVSIRGDATYTLEDLKRLVVHEVDTHVLRAVNGYSQPYSIFAVGAVPSYLMTEEGLAVVNEERMGYVDVPRTRLFAGRVLAATRALRGSFREVYGELRDYGFSHDEAWVTTRRVKRGLGDTAAPGGFIKDHLYLWGRLQVEQYVLGGGDLSKLYLGKIALEHLPRVHELGMRPARFTPLPYT